MVHGRAAIAAWVAWLSFAAPAVRAALIFESGFEIDGACAWSPTGAGDPCPTSRVYAHTGAVLYRIDDSVPQNVLIGPFNTGGPSIVDIAIDRDDNMYAISLAKIWSIDVSTGAAAPIADWNGASDNLTGLSFLPIEVGNPSAGERLIAAGTSGDVYDVNRITGALSIVGNFGLSSGNQLRSAGDLMGVFGVGLFAMVETDADVNDFLATLDPATFAATPLASSTSYDHVFGLGFWNGTFYGFIDNGSGAGTGTMITIDSGTGIGANALNSAFRWFGAAVSTDAPPGD